MDDCRTSIRAVVSTMPETLHPLAPCKTKWFADRINDTPPDGRRHILDQTRARDNQLRRCTQELMKGILSLLLFVALFSGCGAFQAFQASSAVGLGRQELFRGQKQDALESFEVAARADPGYSFGVDRPEGVLSYLGRAQYLNGQYAQARQHLERDLARDQSNSLSRLYLGLTLARLNDRQNGLHDIVWGLTGIRHYIEYVHPNANANDIRRLWDRYNQIRNAIAIALKMTESPNPDWNALISLSERIALAWEQEPDFTRMSPEMTRPYNLNP